MSFSHLYQDHLPKFLCILAIMLSAAPFGIIGIQGLTSHLDMALIIFWCLYRPNSMPYWFVFLLGLFYDLLIGLPLGISACTNMLLKLVVTYRLDNKALEHFGYVWKRFATSCASIALLKTFFVFMWYKEFGSLQTPMLGIVITILLFPILYVALSHITPKEDHNHAQ